MQAGDIRQGDRWPEGEEVGMGLGREVLAWGYLEAYGIERAAAVAGNVGRVQEADTKPEGKTPEDMKQEDMKLGDRKSVGTLNGSKVSPAA